MHGNVCANRDSEESIIDIKNGAEKNFRIIFYIIIGRKYIRITAHPRGAFISVFSTEINMWIT